MTILKVVIGRTLPLLRVLFAAFMSFAIRETFSQDNQVDKYFKNLGKYYQDFECDLVM
jgi:hypothetical protein